MASLDESFAMQNYEDATSLYDAIILGKKYRITVLSDILVRLEYSSNGAFEDRPTERVSFRRFPVPRYTKQEDSNYLIISTKYFKLQYQKEMPFLGSKVSPDQYLKITLNNSDKFWYYGNPEIRNYKGTTYSLDDVLGDVTYDKGLYGSDGFVSIDDSKSLIINKDGSYGQRKDDRIDIVTNAICIKLTTAEIICESLNPVIQNSPYIKNSTILTMLIVLLFLFSLANSATFLFSSSIFCCSSISICF